MPGRVTREHKVEMPEVNPWPLETPKKLNVFARLHG
jgi:hypothetical protein